MPPKSRTRSVRPSPTPKAPKKKSREPPSPQDVNDPEEGLALGIAAEERCERYMTSFGPTAFRALARAYAYFVRALNVAKEREEKVQASAIVHAQAQAQAQAPTLTQAGSEHSSQDQAQTLPGPSLVADLQQQQADAAYNAARTQFTLAAQFTLPPASLTALDESIQLYTLAAQLELQRAVGSSGASGNVSTVTSAREPQIPETDFGLDITYNYATALQARAELLLDVGRANPLPGGSGDYPSFRQFQAGASNQPLGAIDSGASLTVGLVHMAEVRNDLFIAGGLFVSLARAYLARLLERTFLPFDSLGAEQGGPEADTKQPPGLDTGLEATGLDDEAARTQNDASTTMVYTASHINTQSLLDALEGAVNCAQAWASTFDPSLSSCPIPPPSEVGDGVLAALESVQMALSQGGLQADSSDSEDCDAHRFAKERLAVWTLALRSVWEFSATGAGASAGATSSEILSETLQVGQAALQALPDRLTFEPEAVLAVQVADLCIDLASSGIRAVSSQLPVPVQMQAQALSSAQIQQVQVLWDLATLGSRLLLRVQAYASASPATAAFGGRAGGSASGGLLGSGGSSASDASVDLRIETNLSLVQGSMLRAHPIFAVQQGTGPHPPEHTIGLLLGNARVYIRKSLHATSLAWLLTPASAVNGQKEGGEIASLTSQPHRIRRVDGDATLVWDKVQREASVLVTYARILWFRREHGIAPPEEVGELERVVHVAKGLVSQSQLRSAGSTDDQPALLGAWRLAWLHTLAPRAGPMAGADQGTAQLTGRGGQAGETAPTWAQDLAQEEDEYNKWGVFIQSWTQALL